MVPEGRRVFKHLTVDENIRVGSITRKDGTQNVRKDQELMYDHFPRLARVTNRLAGLLFRGRAADDRHCPGIDVFSQNADAG